MSLLLSISAEVAVKSRRQDYQSIFDQSIQHTGDDFRRFYSDPRLTSDAVKRLKKQGFAILSVGPCTVTIGGSASLFEREFKVTLEADEFGPYIKSDESQQSRIASTDGSNFADILAGIVFLRNTTSSGPEPPAKDPPWQLYPHEIPNMLGYTNSKAPTGMHKKFFGKQPGEKPSKERVKIVVIDSGLTPHPYFQRMFPNRKTRVRVPIAEQKTEKQYSDRLDCICKLLAFLEKQKPVLERIRRKIEGTQSEQKQKKLYKQYKGMLSGIKQRMLDDASASFEWSLDDNDRTNMLLERLGDNSDDSDGETHPDPSGLVDFFNKIAIPQLKQNQRIVRELNRHFVLDDAVGHGTMVMANLLPIAPEADILMLKHRVGWAASLSHGGELAGEIIRQAGIIKPQVISCSFSTRVSKGGSPDDADFHSYKQKISSALDAGCIVVFAAGNYLEKGKDDKEEPEQLLSLEAQWSKDLDILVAGGVYKPDDSWVASDYAHGYQMHAGKIVPSVCGLCGPRVAGDVTKSGGLMWTPGQSYKKHPNDWLLGGGTSAATPEVAGLCALIRQIWPTSRARDVKKLLRETGEKVTRGNTAQGKPANALDLRVINIRNAIWLARICSAVQSIWEGTSYDEIMQLVTALVGKPAPAPVSPSFQIQRGTVQYDLVRDVVANSSNLQEAIREAARR